MRVVLDANVFVSALISSRGAPRLIVDAWRDEAYGLLLSAAILTEMTRVMAYPRLAALHGMSAAEVADWLALVREESRVVETNEQIDISPDETDNRYLECAVAGGADYLVTGDKQHLLRLGTLRGIRIVSPATFVAVLQIGPA